MECFRWESMSLFCRLGWALVVWTSSREFPHWWFPRLPCGYDWAVGWLLRHVFCWRWLPIFLRVRDRHGRRSSISSKEYRRLRVRCAAAGSWHWVIGKLRCLLRAVLSLWGGSRCWGRASILKWATGPGDEEYREAGGLSRCLMSWRFLCGRFLRSWKGYLPSFRSFLFPINIILYFETHVMYADFILSFCPKH